MKVLHIITSLEDGGAEAVLTRLVTHSTSHQHTVVSLGTLGKYGPMLDAQGVTVHTLDMPRGRLTFSGIRRLFLLVRQERPNLVQTWMYHSNFLGGVISRLAGCNKVFWGLHHTALVPGSSSNSTRIVDWLCARLSGVVPHRIIACAHESSRIHIANGYDARKVTVIPNGYDVSLFRPDVASGRAVRRELGIEPQTRVVGCVGRWDLQKDHANLIAAMQHVRRVLPEVQLALAGSQCDKNNVRLAEILDSAGLDSGVHLLGRREDVPALMNAFDIHVLSSYSEAFPNVVAEAMACATPCIVTEVGDAAMVVGNTGWSVPPRDPQSLASAILNALEEIQDTETWGERGQAARQRVIDEFSLETMVTLYESEWSSHGP